MAMERENTKKIRVEYHHRCKATLPILNHLENELENYVGKLTSKELEALLWWKGIPVSKMGNIANRRILYQQFAEGGSEEVSTTVLRTENDQTELHELRNAPGTSYMGASWYKTQGTQSGCTRRCPPRRKWPSSKRWWKLMRWVPTMGNPRHIASPPFSYHLVMVIASNYLFYHSYVF